VNVRRDRSGRLQRSKVKVTGPQKRQTVMHIWRNHGRCGSLVYCYARHLNVRPHIMSALGTDILARHIWACHSETSAVGTCHRRPYGGRWPGTALISHLVAATLMPLSRSCSTVNVVTGRLLGRLCICRTRAYILRNILFFTLCR